MTTQWPEWRRCRNNWCRRRLPKSELGKECSTCRARRRLGWQPAYKGPCLDGCGRPAGSRSGYASACYRRLRRRRRHFEGIVRGVAGDALPPDYLLATLRAGAGAPDYQRAHDVMVGLLAAIERGDLALYRPGKWQAARQAATAAVKT